MSRTEPRANVTGADSPTWKSADDADGRGRWRGLYSATFDHPDFRVLTTNARMTLLALLLGPQYTMVGIVPLYTEQLTLQTGLTPTAVDEAIRELEANPSKARPWIVLDRESRLVWIRNGLRFDTALTLKNPNHVKALRRLLSTFPSSSPVIKRLRNYKPYAKLALSSHRQGDGVSHRRSSIPNSYLLTPNSELLEGSHVANRSRSAAPPSPSLAGASYGGADQAGADNGSPMRRPAPGEWDEVLARCRVKYANESVDETERRAIAEYQARLRK
jgi:hypothetical protein